MVRTPLQRADIQRLVRRGTGGDGYASGGDLTSTGCGGQIVEHVGRWHEEQATGHCGRKIQDAIVSCRRTAQEHIG